MMMEEQTIVTGQSIIHSILQENPWICKIPINCGLESYSGMHHSSGTLHVDEGNFSYKDGELHVCGMIIKANQVELEMFFYSTWMLTQT
ncbi:MAG: hypothetical protein IPP49_20075 [Saprospiraceae bacterium]|nr:hypothetical protein [Saprospiraceae bacterium]